MRNLEHTDMANFYPKPSRWTKLSDKLGELTLLVEMNRIFVQAVNATLCGTEKFDLILLSSLHAIYQEKLEAETKNVLEAVNQCNHKGGKNA